MQQQPEPTPPDTESSGKTNAGDQLADKTKAAYKWWNNLSTINADDPLWLGAAKMGVRLVGILILIALSPLILLGFLFAFIAVA